MPQGIVRKIHPNKYSRNGNIFTRIEFIMADGSWAKTDVCPNYRNYKRWVPVIQSGVNTEVTGLTFRQKGEVNGDSYPKIIGIAPEIVGEKPAEPEKPKGEQQSLI